MAEANKFAKKGLVVDVDKAKFVKEPNEGGRPTAKKEKAVKEAKAPKAKKEKAEKVTKDEKISVVNKDHGAREGSMTAAVLSAIIKAQKVSDVVGKSVSTDKGEREINRADLRFAVAKGFIKLV